MVCLLATIANDADYTPALLYALGAEVAVPDTPKGSDEVWGIGYYADGRALIVRKPKEILSGPSFYELSPHVQSRILLAAVERDPPGLEQSPPFRFRRWLFASTGDLRPLESLSERIIDKLPDFVRTDVLDKGGAGLAYGMFLAELFRSGLLDDPLATAAAQAEALARTAQTIERLSTEHDQTGVAASYVATNGKCLLVSGGGEPIYYKEQRGLESLPDGPPDPALTDFKQIAAALKRFRAIVIARNVKDSPGWSAIDKGQTFWVDATLAMNRV